MDQHRNPVFCCRGKYPDGDAGDSHARLSLCLLLALPMCKRDITPMPLSMYDSHELFLLSFEFLDIQIIRLLFGLPLESIPCIPLCSGLKSTKHTRLGCCEVTLCCLLEQSIHFQLSVIGHRPCELDGFDLVAGSPELLLWTGLECPYQAQWL